jgi:hypothetical protein
VPPPIIVSFHPGPVIVVAATVVPAPGMSSGDLALVNCVNVVG